MTSTLRPAFSFEPSARLHSVQIAVDVKLQESRRMVSRPPRLRRVNSVEFEIAEIECFDKRLDHANRIILVDPIVQAFRKQRTLATVRSPDKALHPIPRKSRGNRIARAALSGTFSHSQGQIASFPQCPRYVRLAGK